MQRDLERMRRVRKVFHEDKKLIPDRSPVFTPAWRSSKGYKSLEGYSHKCLLVYRKPRAAGMKAVTASNRMSKRIIGILELGVHSWLFKTYLTGIRVVKKCHVIRKRIKLQQ